MKRYLVDDEGSMATSQKQMIRVKAGTTVFQVSNDGQNPSRPLRCILSEIQKEQGDTEIAVSELSMGRRVMAGPKKKWLDVQNQISRIVRRRGGNNTKRRKKKSIFLELFLTI